MSAVITIPVRVVYDPLPLRKAMREQRLSQRRLSEERGCHYVTINRVLMGRAASPEIVEWLCERLNVARPDVIKDGTPGEQKNLPDL